MSYSLRFRILHAYSSTDSGIPVPVRISAGSRSVDLLANLDTGASFCIFQREFGEELGMRIEAGERQKFRTATGSFWTFAHPVSLDVLGLRFDTTVYFTGAPNFPRNVLGRQGWLNRVRLALVDYDSRLYLSAYGD